LTGESIRTWLCVPDGFVLPDWTQAQLEAGIRTALEAREGTPLERVVFGIVDLETTGLSAQRDRILEIGLVVLRGGKILERFSTLVAVDLPLPRIITEITGIDAEELQEAPQEAEALEGFASVIRAQRVDVLVAHNARFDRQFLQRAWRCNELTPDLPTFLCSLRLARAWVRAPSYGLDRLVAQLGIPMAPRHRALGDAEMTATLWQELLARGRLQGVHTLEALCQKAELGRPRRSTRRVRVVDV
jgi:DNA polymerase-3 subunit epsilon